MTTPPDDAAPPGGTAPTAPPETPDRTPPAEGDGTTSGAATPSAHRLERSRDDRMIAGVAGGLAEHFDLDPVLVRVVFVLAAVLTQGAAILFYLGAWIVMPEAGDLPRTRGRAAADREARRDARSERRRDRHGGGGGIVLGLILVAVGVVALLQRAELDVALPPVQVTLSACLIAVGAGLLVESRRGLNGGLLALAIIVSLALGVAERASGSLDGNVGGSRTVEITRVTELDDSYGHAFGSLTLDLSGLTLPNGTTEIDASVAFGDLTVRLPAGAAARVEASTVFGSASVLGRNIDGIVVDDTRDTANYDTASARLLIHVTTVFGSASVR